MPFEEAMIEQMPEMLGGLQPVVDTIRPMIVKLSFILGGIFGLYLILIFVRIYYERRHVRLLQDIRYDLDQLNSHYGLRTSQHQLGFFKRLIESFRKKRRERKMEKMFRSPHDSDKHKARH